MRRKLLSAALLVTASIALLAHPVSAGANSAALFGKIHGQVRLSPICPVEVIPANPACSPRPYKTTIKIMSARGDRLLKTLSTNSVGYFRLTFPVGTYLLKTTGGSPYPRCASELVKIAFNKNLKLSITCDSGTT